MSSETDMSCIVCQIGARENFSLARALARRGMLEMLVTDIWCKPDMPLRDRLGRFGERTHRDLSDQRVWAPSLRAVLRELSDRRAGRQGWDQILHRNAWFQRMALQRLKRLDPKGPVTLFAYSYAAADILAYAKSRGWRTVLGQIDPGPVEARLVEKLYDMPGQQGVHHPIPAQYWDNWRRETDLADLIAVNSDWSRQGLVAEGVATEKIITLPLAYEPVMTAKPRPADKDAPLRLLFLGQVTLRKGIDLVFEALQMAPDLPVMLDVVGPLQVSVPEAIRSDPRITFHGSVARSTVANFYDQADLFLFPTRSDGFGLTQLEALSAGVPVIASRHCGTVVEHNKNGLILQDLTAKNLADQLRMLTQDRAQVAQLRAGAHLADRFSIDALSQNLFALLQQVQHSR
ncbi:glycosyltransferase family 4 protein [uncultured Pelagimonas sp.]|uniref:glycosyltransferase family 4 protein n=1 Tax=uncultured Pelagimonas sp. TaxID=1618102 RepID=UPI00261D0554|nr:glycosyltransferase family 4 protein [uncultured Pelagimonas sp.]